MQQQIAYKTDFEVSGEMLVNLIKTCFFSLPIKSIKII